MGRPSLDLEGYQHETRPELDGAWPYRSRRRGMGEDPQPSHQPQCQGDRARSPDQSERGGLEPGHCRAEELDGCARRDDTSGAAGHLPVDADLDRQHQLQRGSAKRFTRGQKWASLLVDLASAPYPIPEKLQLTCFLDLTNSTQYAQFLALPSFSAGNDYDPSGQVPALGDTSDYWEIANVNGIKMRSEFSHPTMGTLLQDDSLWLPPAQSAERTPLVANWQAHLYELLGPYLDTAHLLTSAIYDPVFPKSLGDTLGTNPADWMPFRDCVLRGLYVLVSGKFKAADYDAATWTTALRKQLAGLDPMPNVLADKPSSFGSFAQLMTDLRRTVAAASTGANLAVLVGSQNNSVPSNYLAPENAPALLALLQSRLATVFTSEIVAAANAAPGVGSPTLVDLMTAVLQSLLQTVLRPNLLAQLNFVFPAASPLPAALGAACYPVFAPAATAPQPSSTISFRNDLFTLSLGTAQPGSAPALTANASPLVLPAVAAHAADKTGKAVDPLRGFRGVSVLLRRTEKDSSKWTNWTCPGIVAPVTRQIDPATHKPGDVAHADLPMLVATRLVYDRDLLTGSMLYNDGPFACANLLHGYMNQEDQLRHTKPGDPNFPQGVPDPSAIPDSVLKYASYEGGGRLAPGTAALWAGWSMEFVTFAISNSGAIPAALRDRYPSRFKLIDNVTNPLPVNVKTSTVRYFRTVPVAGLETCDALGKPLQNTSAPNTAPLFPVVPANVWPQATDTKTPAGGQGITPATPVQDPQPHLPLLLLTPPDSKHKAAERTTPNFTFSVRLPSVDPQTWLTTVANNHTNADLVLDGAYLRLRQQHRASITDPLIASVDFTIYVWQSPGWAAASLPVSYTRAELIDKGSDALPGVETVPIVVAADTGFKANKLSFSALTVDQTPRDAKSLDGSGFAFQQGKVYLLEARLTLDLITPDGISKMPRYAPGHATPPPNAPPLPPGSPAPPPCIAGYQLLIEVGSTAMPGDLISPLSLKLLPNSGLPDQQVQFSLAAKGDNWQNVHRVDFLRQMWKWTGRTQPLVVSIETPGDLLAPQFFPAPPVKLDDPVTVAWELIEFAERPPVDHIESLSALNPATTAYEFTLDLSLDPRATYLRVAPRVYSRYQGLWADTSWSVVSSIDVPGNEAWQRTFVRSRTRTLKMPRLKALLPLTESAFTPGTPGILAVFDGPAYEQAGLAERLHVSFATVADPDLSGNVWAQAGPDFLAGAVQPLTAPGQQLVPDLLAIGPIGHTADPLSGLDHKFLSHSYIIRPDPAKPNGTRDFSWWFASLNFQVRTDAASSVLAQPILSETAFGSWIQFLPGFQDSTNNADHFDDWTFTVTIAPGGAVVFTLLDRAGKPQTPGEATVHLTPFLMVNRIVMDIVGKPREEYLGIAVYSKPGYSLLGNDWTPGTKAQVRVIQTRQGLATKFNDHVEFWQSVVGSGNEALPSDPKRNFPNDRERTVPVNLSAPIKAAEAS